MSLETYISEFSKYVIAIIMALFTLEGFVSSLKRSEDKRKGNYARQNILMFAFHFSAYMVICFETGEISYLIFYAFQQIVLYAVIMLYKSVYPSSNRLIINNMCMLLSVSFVMLSRLEYTKALKQFVIATGALIIAILIPFFIKHIRMVKDLKWLYAILGIGLLGTMMILGQTTYGSKISYSIAGITFQPAEFVKIIFVFFVASALYRSSTFLEVVFTSLIAGAHVLIQVANKDLGSAVIFFIVYIFMLYIATQKIWYLLAGLAAGAGASIVAYQNFSHIRVRVQAFLDPWTYIDSTGYQITQSLFAISSGGWFGLGLFKGTPSSIPFVEDDFIFSAITEELGVIFAICLIFICVTIFIIIMKISMTLTDKFYQLVALGLGIAYIFQVFLTIGGGTKFIPLTGVTLPLVSYGGSSMLTTIIMFAIVEGLYMISQKEASLGTLAGSEPSKPKKVAKKKSFKSDIAKKRSTNTNRRSKDDYYDDRHDDEYDDYYDDDDYDDRYDDEYDGEYDDEYDDEYDGEYDDEYDDEYDEDYDDEYDDEYDEEYDDNDKSSGDELEFLSGFTTPIDTKLVKQLIEDDDEGDIDISSISEIYYNEEEYQKDQRRQKNKKN